MADFSQNSIISYVPQPMFIAGTCEVLSNTNISSIENGDGLFDPDLSNFTTINATSGAATFVARVNFNRETAHLSDHNVMVGLIGCALTTYEDSGGSPDPDTAVSEDIMCFLSHNLTTNTIALGYAHGYPNDIHTFCKEPLPGIISGGRANVLFSGLGTIDSNSDGIVYIQIERLAANVSARPWASLVVGHLFIGTELAVVQDPQSFSWTLEVRNERAQARDLGAVSSEGTIMRIVSGEIRDIPHQAVTGSVVTGLTSGNPTAERPNAVDLVANFFDMVKVNNSYPVVFNPYPYALFGGTGGNESVDGYNLAARQNFFSVYGFLDGPLEITVDEYRDGLASQYRARFRIEETR